MPIHDELGLRMKNNYEKISQTKLMRRTPVAIRVDGKAFHTFCRGFEKPFDNVLVSAMQDTMKYLCENIQGCVFGYTQSDEITLILIDYKKLNSSAFFDYEVQKICSIVASMATLAFNKFFNKYSLDAISTDTKEDIRLCGARARAVEKGAMFDARRFNIPKEEVCNLIYWRQLDATRNSIQMVGQANFSHKQLQNKTCNDIQDMLFEEKGINWNDYPTMLKRGTACYKDETWKIDKEMPILKGEDRSYVDRHIFVGE